EKLRSQAATVVDMASQLNESSDSLLEAIVMSEITSICQLSEEYQARGITGVCQLLRKVVLPNVGSSWLSMQKTSRDLFDKISEFNITEAKKLQQHDEPKLFKPSSEHTALWEMVKVVDANDSDTSYFGECMSATARWIRDYSGSSQSERTVDMYIIGPFSKTPQVKYLYGENRLEADRSEKAGRSESSRVGKACDYIFLSHDRESGIGENSGPQCKDHVDKATTDFVDVIKVARSQHIAIGTACIEASGVSPLPVMVQNALYEVSIPFFQVIGSRIRFYLLLNVDGDIFAFFEWASEKLPIRETDVDELTCLCRRFLTHRNLLNHTGKMSELAIKKAKRCRSMKTLPPATMCQTSNLILMQTPEKPKKRA
ncbi:1102_t:CDS:2, partial [Paraglomus occultum]